MTVQRQSVLLLLCACFCASGTSQTPVPSKPDAAPRLDQLGDPLPPEVLARCGSNRLRFSANLDWLLFSPDNQTLAACRFGGVISLWDTSTAKLRHIVPLPWRGPPLPKHAVFSADGKRLIFVTDGNNPECVVVDVDRGEVVGRTRLEKDPNGLLSNGARLSPDGTMVAIARMDAVPL